MSKSNIINVQGTEISVTTINDNDYISLTDMVKARDDDSRAADIIKNWIRTRSTIESLGVWKIFIIQILKWSNLTTLKKRRVCQPSR